MHVSKVLLSLLHLILANIFLWSCKRVIKWRLISLVSVKLARASDWPATLCSDLWLAVTLIPVRVRSVSWCDEVAAWIIVMRTLRQIQPIRGQSRVWLANERPRVMTVLGDGAGIISDQADTPGDRGQGGDRQLYKDPGTQARAATKTQHRVTRKSSIILANYFGQKNKQRNNEWMSKQINSLYGKNS